MAAAVEVIQHVRQDAPFNLPRSLQLAAGAHGKSAWAQLCDLWRLRFGPGKLRPDEYYAFGLYDDRRFTAADKRTFLGRAVQNRIIRRCNAQSWWLLGPRQAALLRPARGPRACRRRRPGRSVTRAERSGRP